MSAIPATSGATSTNNLSASSLSLQDFLNVLLTQLTYQDPLKPMDNQQFMAQLAQFSTLAQSQDLNAKVDSLISTQSSLQSVGLIGKAVSIATQSGQVDGTVTTLSLSGSAPTISVHTANGDVSGIPLSQLISVTAPAATPSGP